MANDDQVTVFGTTHFRNQDRRFGIKIDDRRRHMYVLGKSGTGKSTLLENMIIQDIQAGRGVAVVDPHGELVEKVLKYVPPSRINDTIYFNPADLDFPIAFNVMEKVAHEHQHLVASGLVGVFKKLWADSWGPRLEYILRNAILALLEYPGSTLLGVMRLFIDKDFRKRVIGTISDPVVKSFWEVEYAKYNQQFQVEAVAPIQNKVGQFLSSALIRNIIGQVHSSIDLRKVMDEKKILLLNLSKGRIGEDNSALLGSMLITKLQLAAMSRVDMPESERSDFYLYVDEFQNFVTESFANILSEARKYRLALILAHQYIGQLVPGGSTTIRDAVFGNVGSLVIFRVGAEDATFLETEFDPTFTPQDIVNLPNFTVYLKLMIDGITSQPFSARTLPPALPSIDTDVAERVIRVTRERYSTPRAKVEEKIFSWTQASLEGASQEAAEPKEPRFPPGPRYPAVCDACGKETSTPFPPDPNRPTFCPDCLRLYRAGKIPAPQKRQVATAQPAAASPAAPAQATRPAEQPRPAAVRPPTPAVAPARQSPPSSISLNEAVQQQPSRFIRREPEPRAAQPSPVPPQGSPAARPAAPRVEQPAASAATATGEVEPGEVVSFE